LSAANLDTVITEDITEAITVAMEDGTVMESVVLCLNPDMVSAAL